MLMHQQFPCDHSLRPAFLYFFQIHSFVHPSIPGPTRSPEWLRCAGYVAVSGSRAKFYPEHQQESQVPAFASLTRQVSTVQVESSHCPELFPRHHTLKCPLVLTSFSSDWFC